MGVPVEDSRPVQQAAGKLENVGRQILETATDLSDEVQDSRLVQDNAGRPADDRYSMEQEVGVVGRRLVHALNKTKN